jgi:hypothetical protein
MLDNALDRPVLAARIPTFEYDKDLVVMFDGMPLDFDEFNLEGAKRHLISLIMRQALTPSSALSHYLSVR